MPEVKVIVPLQCELQDITREIEASRSKLDMLIERRDAIILDIRSRNDHPKRASLPLDVIQCIVDHARVRIDWGTDSSRDAKKFLLGLCTVSQNWVVPGRRALYREVSLAYIDQTAFWTTIRNVPQVRGYVRHLHAHLNPAHAQWVDHMSLLPSCEVRISVFGVLSNHFEELRSTWPKIIMLKQVKLLFLYDYSISVPEYLPPDQRWAHLEQLHISAYDLLRTQFPLRPHFADTQFDSLVVLKLTSCFNVVFPDTAPNTLRTLQMDNCRRVDAGSLLLFVRKHAQSLRNLAIASTHFGLPDGTDGDIDDGSHILDLVASAAQTAQELMLEGHHQTMSSQVLLNLSPTVVELSLISSYLNPWDFAEMFNRRVALTTSQNFRMVEVRLRSSPSAEAVGKWKEVQATVKQSGAEFFITFST